MRAKPSWRRTTRTRRCGCGSIACVRDRRRLRRASSSPPGWTVRRHPFAPDALQVAPPADVRSVPGFAEGRLSVQDAAAQLAVELLDAAGGRAHPRCLRRSGRQDLPPARAGGGTSRCHGPRRVRGRGSRASARTSTRLGLRPGSVAGDVGHAGGPWWDGRPFDRVLLDVPVFRPPGSSAGIRTSRCCRRAQDIPALARQQRELLAAAWGLVQPGGRLLYTSCSVLRGRERGCRRVLSLAGRGRPGPDTGTTRRLAVPAGRAGPGYQVHARRGRHGRVLLCLSGASTAMIVGNEQQPEPVPSQRAAIPALRPDVVRVLSRNGGGDGRGHGGERLEVRSASLSLDQDVYELDAQLDIRLP